jgi:hypothetical protein
MPSSVEINRTGDPLDPVRDVIRRHLPQGYEEVASGAFTVWQVPLSTYPDTYNGKPLWYCALAPQKNYLSLYMMSVYGSPKLEKQLRDGFKAAGKKLDMGKSCITFRNADDLALDVIGAIVSAIPVDKWIGIAKEAREKPARSGSRKSTAGKEGAGNRKPATGKRKPRG